MAEAYECDRCESLHSGSPDTDMQVLGGIRRYGKQDDKIVNEHIDAWGSEMFDLCAECRKSLRQWLLDGGADSVAFMHADEEETPEGNDE